MRRRIDWIDQVKGWAIFLVVYGHNFPVTEKYIYTFHMPLFFMIAGFFHPREQTREVIARRAKYLLVPYFLWASILYVFWFFAGRKFGESAAYHLSPLKNFAGIFYAQGGREYMDWGIPLWFLPAMFLTFLLFYLVRSAGKYQYLLLALLVVSGFLIPGFVPRKLPWSLDVAMVALAFYSAGFYTFSFFKNAPSASARRILVLTGILHAVLYFFNSKVDMYRSEYGRAVVFLLNGWAGSTFYLLLFRELIRFPFLSYIGKYTIPILAMQLRAMTVIKAFLIYVAGRQVLDFSEGERLLYSVVQILLMIPVFFLIDKYAPILNGSPKKT